jgi:hypothetical protein
MFFLSTSSPTYLHSTTVDTQHGYVHGHCLLPLSKYVHPLNCIFELSSHDIVPLCLLSRHDTYILQPIPSELSIDLLNVNSCDILPFCKSTNFIETKVTAINCRDLTIV